MVIHSFYFTPEEAGRIESAVRRGIHTRTAPRVGRDEQSSAGIEHRVRERLADL
jgi:hypothetical protein